MATVLDRSSSISVNRLRLPAGDLEDKEVDMKHSRHVTRPDTVRPRRPSALLATSALAVALLALGVWSAGALAGGARASKATVSLHSTGLGRVLADPRGHTLYLFLKDRNGKSACTGMCPRYWPPLLARAKPSAGSGVRAAWLATTRRSDGKLQVTYRRHPVYTYVLDKKAGQTAGEGVSAFGATWWAVSANGTAVRKAAPTPTTSTTTTPYPGNPYP
jgi:predicted lipoprotein with Yx(FWY)xxD motif